MRLLITDCTWPAMTMAVRLRDMKFRLSPVDDGEGLLLGVEQGAHDAVLIDADLPDMTALAAVRGARGRCARLPIVVLAPGLSRGDRAALYRAGADLVLSPRPGTAPDAGELAARLRAMVLRVHGFSGPEIRLGALTLDVARRTARVGGVHLALAPTEYELLEILALAHGRTLPREELMLRLYAWDEDAPDARVLDVHLARLRRKIVAAGGPRGAVATVWGRGLRLVAAAPPLVA